LGNTFSGGPSGVEVILNDPLTLTPTAITFNATGQKGAIVFSSNNMDIDFEGQIPDTTTGLIAFRLCNQALCDAADFSLVTSDLVVASAVPEPSTWAMLLLGFAGVGFMGYRRSRKDQALALVVA
jgi:hypothetical protein